MICAHLKCFFFFFCFWRVPVLSTFFTGLESFLCNRDVRGGRHGSSNKVHHFVNWCFLRSGNLVRSAGQMEADGLFKIRQDFTLGRWQETWWWREREKGEDKCTTDSRLFRIHSGTQSMVFPFLRNLYLFFPGQRDLVSRTFNSLVTSVSFLEKVVRVLLHQQVWCWIENEHFSLFGWNLVLYQLKLDFLYWSFER